ARDGSIQQTFRRFSGYQRRSALAAFEDRLPLANIESRHLGGPMTGGAVGLENILRSVRPALASYRQRKSKHKRNIAHVHRIQHFALVTSMKVVSWVDG